MLTCAFASKLTASFFTVNAHPGTKLYEQVEAARPQRGLQGREPQLPEPELPAVAGADARAAGDAAPGYIRFFTSPARVWRIIATTPRKRQLWHFGWDLAHRVFDAFRARQRNIYAAEGVPHFDAARELEAVTPYNAS
ncbi:MAG: hypothetical protein U1E76_21855 [Planctomycetota bacterium]